MLLLVLILVVMAFGLLLVGFLSGSVLWAWVSVAVSVVAFLVLLFDTLQRRSVVKAGDESRGADSAGDTGRGNPAAQDRPATTTGHQGARTRDIEPVTEVIPIIRPSTPSPPQSPFDPDADSQQTVMMPAVGPSGSPKGPSGATSSTTLSSEDQLPSVVAVGSERSASADRPGEADEFRSTADDDRRVGGSGPSTTTAVDQTAAVDSTAAVDQTAAMDSTGDVRADASTVATRDSIATDSPDAPPADLFENPETGPRGVPAAVDPKRADPQRADPDHAENGSRGVDPARESRDNPPGGSDLTGAVDMPGEPDDEPPEERPDAGASALVAGLDDEVIVIDELPRYHVPGCRTLLGASLIPLPVCEAVELGFTPCGWCTPVRILTGRHSAAAR